MWKCSCCPQTSTRRWNLKVHIQRLHNGVGKPIYLQYNGRSKPVVKSLEDSGSQNDRDQQNIPSQNPDFIDAFHQFIFNQLPEKMKKWKEIFTFTSLVGGNAVSNGIQNLRTMSSPYAPPRAIADQKPPTNQGSIFGFEAMTCEKCLSAIILEVIIANGTEGVGMSLIKSSHACGPENYVSSQRLEEIKQMSATLIPENNRKLPINEFYAGLLKYKCHQWIKDEVKLVSVKIGWSKRSIKILPEPAKGVNHWAVRAVQYSHTVLKDEELIEFLKLCEGRTFNVFELNTDNAINASNNYLLYIHWLPSPPLEIESMISNYF